MLRIIYCLCLFIILSVSKTSAQSDGSVSGKVTGLTSKAPMEFVNIVLKKVKDSTVVIHEVTNIKGQFKLTNIPQGSYFIQAGFVGFDNQKTAAFSIDAQHSNISVQISMDDSRQVLKEVQISTKKNIFTNSIDRKVYNVDMDLMAKSGSASEILQNVPLVQVDIDGNVSLRNSAVTILINGKVSPLMGKNAAVVLQQLPAGSIDRIEVITNPSAKYKPDGTGGIINIILKKNVNRGLNGNLTANTGTGKRYNANASFNYNPGQFNLFGSYSMKQDDRVRTTINNRTQTDPKTEIASYYHDDLTAMARPFSHIASAGIDYQINEKNSVGITGNYYLRNIHKNDLTIKQVNSISIGNQDYDRIRKNFEQESNTDATAYYEHAFQKENHKIRLEFNIAHSPEVEDNHYTNTYRFPELKDQLDNTLIKQTTDNKNLRLNYENPLSKTNKLEAGYDGQYNKQDMDFYGATFDPVKQQFITDLNRTNRFVYYENVHALYGTFSH